MQSKCPTCRTIRSFSPGGSGTGNCIVRQHRQVDLSTVSAKSRRIHAAQSNSAEKAAQQQQQRTRTVRLRKPVGVVFAQNKGGPVYVEEITPGSNADKCGQIQVGDVLSQCSAVVLKAGKEGQYEKEGYGQRLYDNWETIIFNAEGCDFKTVMSALKSNNERWGIMDVTLVFRKPTADEVNLCEKAGAA